MNRKDTRGRGLPLTVEERPGDWTGTELATLNPLAETFVAGDAARRARIAAEGLELAADAAQLLQPRHVLRAIESPAVSLVLAGRLTGFVAMAPEAREGYLLGWANSRIPQRRSAFAVFRKLLTFLAYAPGGDGLAIRTSPRSASQRRPAGDRGSDDGPGPVARGDDAGGRQLLCGRGPGPPAIGGLVPQAAVSIEHQI